MMHVVMIGRYRRDSIEPSESRHGFTLEVGDGAIWAQCSYKKPTKPLPENPEGKLVIVWGWLTIPKVDVGSLVGLVLNFGTFELVPDEMATFFEDYLDMYRAMDRTTEIDYSDPENIAFFERFCRKKDIPSANEPNL